MVGTVDWFSRRALFGGARPQFAAGWVAAIRGAGQPLKSLKLLKLAAARVTSPATGLSGAAGDASAGVPARGASTLLFGALATAK